jgi:asparagine synthase (glutamine-hydrolysing)
VIVHGYEEWGIDSISRFNGMYAFALWDNRLQKLWVARDRLGVKPLYYYSDEELFICASEIKPILMTGHVDAALNEDVLDAYFSVGYVPGPQTMFKNIMKVTPGHYLIVDRGLVHDHEYWDFIPDIIRDVTFSQAKEEIEELLLDSVRKRLMSDVPLGVFLSGGLDSSAVVGLMRNVVGSSPIDTFTIGYHDGYSEEKYARLVADIFNTRHHVFHLEAQNFLDSLKTLVQYAEEPIVEPAAIPLFHISKLARTRAIVLLSGEGSDEIFGGYYLYRFMLNIDVLHSILPRCLYPALQALGARLPKDKYQKYADWLQMPLKKRYQGTSSYLTPSLKEKYYSKEFGFKRSTYLEDCFSEHFRKVKGCDPLMQMLYVDTKTWLVDDLLVKADKMTMATSVELRVPFLDYRLVEAVAKLPSHYKCHKRTGKMLLKKMMEPYLPREIVHRTKMGFPVPTRDWFKGDLIPAIRTIVEGLGKTSWFKANNVLDNMLKRHQMGLDDHSKILMSLLVIDEWKKQYLQ